MGHKKSFLPAVSDLLLRHIRVFPSFFGFRPRFRNGHLSFLLVFFLFHFLPFLVRHHLQRRTTNRAHVRVLRGLKISNIEKKALVLILLVLVFTHKIKIKKKHVRIHSTFKVIRACLFILIGGTESYTTSTTNMYHKDFTYQFLPFRGQRHVHQIVQDVGAGAQGSRGQCGMPCRSLYRQRSTDFVRPQQPGLLCFEK